MSEKEHAQGSSFINGSVPSVIDQIVDDLNDGKITPEEYKKRYLEEIDRRVQIFLAPNVKTEEYELDVL